MLLGAQVLLSGMLLLQAFHSDSIITLGLRFMELVLPLLLRAIRLRLLAAAQRIQG